MIYATNGKPCAPFGTKKGKGKRRRKPKVGRRASPTSRFKAGYRVGGVPVQ